MKKTARCPMAALTITGVLALAWTFIPALPAYPQVSTMEPKKAPDVPFTDWKNMVPDSFLIDIDEMDDRCLDGAAVTSVTATECQEARAMLQAGQCQYVGVPDGIRYEFLLGLKGGKKHVFINKIKRLTVTRMAFSCTVPSTGRVIDWFAGEDGLSCGNVAARPLPPPSTPPKEETPVEVEYEWIQVCDQVPTQMVTRSPARTIPGFVLEDCCCEDTYFSGVTLTWDDTILGTGTVSRNCRMIKVPKED